MQSSPIGNEALTLAERFALEAHDPIGRDGVVIDVEPERSDDPAQVVSESGGPELPHGEVGPPAGRASLCVQQEAFPYAYVTVEGPVAFAEATHDLRVAIASRYLGAEQGEAYVEGGSGDDTALVLTPETWRTVDYAKL